MEDVKVYTVREFALIMKISQSMAYKMIREGRVRSVSCGDRHLIPSKAVDDLLSGDHTPTGTASAC